MTRESDGNTIDEEARTFMFAMLVVLSFAQADGNRAHVLLAIDRVRPVRQ
jgi:hypothetical protein